MIDPEPQEKEARPRQLRLLEVGNPLTTRFGSGFFQGLPRQPGVYFFYDGAGRLLYIGQSNNLRARVGSYRHVAPERHPRRTLRLVHRIARIEFTTCGTPIEAQELEATLLLERRPPFNRAGVWRPPPWWLALDHTGDSLAVSLVRSPPAGTRCTGPLPSSFRYVYASLFRCLLRLLNPSLGLAGFPVGWLNPTIPPLLRLPLPQDQTHIPDLIHGFADRRCDQLLNTLQTALTPENFPNAAEQSFWLEQLEIICHFNTKKKPFSFETPAPLPGKRDAEPTFL